MLLGMIENIECQGQTTKAVHMEGISKLFEVVGHRVLANVDESSLNGWIFTQMFYRAAKRITASDGPPSTPSEQRDMLVPVIKQAMAIAAGLAAIDREAIPTKLQPQQTTDKRPTAPQNQPLISFQSQWTACKWSLFTMFLVLFFERLHLCSKTLLQLGTTNSPETQLAKTAATIADKQLTTMIHMLSSAMPYLMGEVDSQGLPLPAPQRQNVVMYHMVWPLAVTI
ncbi:hypothetical protein FocnCong_v009580 [Fusarium oxysporum f. sp. conglutinans]|nr:hypothetical protein FocnCong_v009580 [Fusarium oxysporum f. sp. conglutinans]